MDEVLVSVTKSFGAWSPPLDPLASKELPLDDLMEGLIDLSTRAQPVERNAATRRVTNSLHTSFNPVGVMNRPHWFRPVLRVCGVANSIQPKRSSSHSAATSRALFLAALTRAHSSADPLHKTFSAGFAAASPDAPIKRVRARSVPATRSARQPWPAEDVVGNNVFELRPTPRWVAERNGPDRNAATIYTGNLGATRCDEISTWSNKLITGGRRNVPDTSKSKCFDRQTNPVSYPNNCCVDCKVEFQRALNRIA